MYVATVSFELLLPGDVRSLKQKRSYVRPIVAELQRRHSVAVAEVGHWDTWRRTKIAVATVSAEAAHATAVLDACERQVAGRPEVELLSVRRRFHHEDDE